MVEDSSIDRPLLACDGHGAERQEGEGGWVESCGLLDLQPYVGRRVSDAVVAYTVGLEGG